MKPLIILRDKDIFPEQGYGEITEWQERKTAKIIVWKDGKVALVTNPVHSLFLLPGGGVDGEEDILTAANREAQEEIRYSIKSPRIIASTEEYRGREKKHYTTYGVVADADAVITDDFRTKNEKDLGLSVRWFSEDEAQKLFEDQLQKLKKGEVKFYTGFNIMRDKILFEAAIKANL